MFKSLFAAIAIFLASIFGGHQVAAPSQPAAVAAYTPVFSPPTTKSGTVFINKTPDTSVIYDPEASPTVTPLARLSTSYVTQASLDQQIAALQGLVNQLLSAQHSTIYSNGAPAVQTFLGNTIPPGLPSPLTAANIPTDITAANYLPLSGGTVSGSLTLGNATSTAFFATTASSTNLFASIASLANATIGSLTLTNALTVANGGMGTSTIPSANKILLSDASGNWEYVATSSLGIISGGGTLTSIGPAGQTQIGPTVTLATSTNPVNGLTSALTITGTGNTITFAPSLSGTLTVAGGGTGWASLASGAILFGNGSGALATTTPGTAGYVLAYLNGLPTWTATTTLATISGTLAVTSGGMGTTTWNTNSIPYFNGTYFTSNNANLNFNGTTLTAGNLLSLASSTIGDGTQAGGLTISGGATTTGSSYFAGNVGIGTTLSSAAPSNSIGARGNIYGGGTWLTGLQLLTTPGMISNGSLKSAIPILIAGPITVFTPVNYCQEPGLVRLQNGLLYLSYRCGTDDNSYDGAPYYQTSTDNGATWSAQQTLLPIVGSDLREISLTLLRSGKVIMSYSTRRSGLLDQLYVMIGDPTPTGITWGNPILIPTPSLFQASIISSDTSGKVLELQNGTLMLPVYGMLSGGSNRSATVVFSIDGGLTWGGQVTVAAADGVNWYSESNAVQLPSGRIVMLIRQDAGTTGFAYSYSDNNGATWSSPTNVIAVSTPGRPSTIVLGSGGIFFMGRSSTGTITSASWDGGATWVTPTSLGGAEAGAAMVLQSSGDIGTVSTRGIISIVYREFADGYGLFGNGISFFKNTTIDDQNGSFTLSYNSTRYLTVTHDRITSNAETTGNESLFLSMLGGKASTGYGAIVFQTGASSLSERMRITQSGNVGIGNTSPSNGLSVTGNADFSGKLGIGTTTPWTNLSIAALSSNTAPLFTISTSTASATSTALLIDSNGNVGIGTSSPTTALQVNGSITPNADNAFTNGNATYKWSVVYATNGTIQTSDERLKENIATTTYGLDQIMQLRPVSFTWIAQPQQGTKLGFIAQEVQPILPETVNTGDDANHTLGLTYSEFIPIIVRAIQQLATTVAGFADNIVSAHITVVTGDFNQVNTQKLCVKKSDGTPVCINGDQLAAVLANANQTAASSPAVDAPSAPDTTPPTITIAGDNPATIHIGDTYNDLGASVTDNVDQNLGLKYFLNGALVSNIVIDTSAAATDTIDYVATDQAGNTATSTRTVIVESPAAAEPAPTP